MRKFANLIRHLTDIQSKTDERIGEHVIKYIVRFKPCTHAQVPLTCNFISRSVEESGQAGRTMNWASRFGWRIDTYERFKLILTKMELHLKLKPKLKDLPRKMEKGSYVGSLLVTCLFLHYI